MKIVTKLIYGHLFIAVSVIAIGISGLMIMQQVGDRYSNLVDETIPVIEALQDIRFWGLRTINSTNEYMLLSLETLEEPASPPVIDANAMKKELKEIKDALVHYDDAVGRYQVLVNKFFPDETELLKSAEESSKKIQSMSSKIIALNREPGHKREFYSLQREFEEIEDGFLESFVGAIEHETEEIQERKSSTRKSIQRGALFALAMTLGILLISSGLGFLLVRLLQEPVSKFMQFASEIGKAKFSARISVTSKDEIGALAEVLNKMAEDLEKTSKALAQSEKMAAVGQLAGGVAHEINNPLGVILGFAQSVVKRLKPGDALEMPLESIEREAIRCKGLVQNLLTFSRIGKTEKEWVDLNQAIESALSLVLAQVKVTNSQLIKEFDETLPKVLVNNNQIQQIIINLSNNAMDAMPQGGTLTLRTKKTKLDDKDAVQIEVQDTGQGIPKELQSKIFEPFFTTKEVGKGTGLGLSLVFEIVQKYDGQITVESEVGKGTMFKILLPGHGMNR